MAKYLKRKSSIPNPALKPLSVVIGNWKYVGKHRLLPDTTLLGHTTFEWLARGAYLIMRDYDEEKAIPSSTSIFGSDDDSAEVYTMLYFDERGVSRIFKWSFRNNV